MSQDNLDIAFAEAFEKVSNMEQDSLPQDDMLRLYAFYKQASFGALGGVNYSLLEGRDAFKMNAWMQVSHLTEDEAKKQYVDLVNELLKRYDKK